MVRVKKVDIRLRKDEYEKIVECSISKGYDNISAYVRAVVLGRDFFMDKTIMETNAVVKKMMEKMQGEE